jgi:DNA-binding CsgD family transcriptional regulator
MRGGMFLATIGEHLIQHGQVERGEALLREGIEDISRERPDAMPLFLGSLANVHIDRGELNEAGSLLERSLAYHREPPHRQPVALTERLCTAAEIAAERGRPEDAARLVGASLTILERTGMMQHTETDRMLARVHTRLDPMLDSEHQATAMAIGRGMPVPQAIDLALDIARMRAPETAPAGASATTSPDDGLTARQREILTLLAEGKSNAAIADALYISERTVTTHLTRIYDRLGVATRTEAVARAARMGLTATSGT